MTARPLPLSRIALALAVGMAAALCLVAVAFGAMRSTKLGPGLCETTGGGRFVDIPGFPGEMIDRRLLDDVRMLERRYKIFVTDGYSMSGVHSPNGEHPIGLALDIVPNKALGGTWNKIDKLAAWAEPKQGSPRTPFRWVGYDGDAGHGRGHHLHLSWGHSEVKPGRSARTVYTVRCPGSSTTTTPPKPPEPEPEPQPPAGGGTVPGGSGGGGGNGNHVTAPASGSGGIASKPRMAPVVGETAGVDG
jgi:hypothetical protein